jgi:hypothetical protein
MSYNLQNIFLLKSLMVLVGAILLNVFLLNIIMLVVTLQSIFNYVLIFLTECHSAEWHSLENYSGWCYSA